MKRALIVGSRGQDGRLLAELLTRQGYSVAGLSRQGLDIQGQMVGPAADLADFDQARAVVEAVRPHEIYYLAAFHHPSGQRGRLTPRDLWAGSMAVNASGPLCFLDAVRVKDPKVRFFYAGSCLAYGDPDHVPQNESTCFRPRCVYGISKTAGMHAVRHFRETYGLFAVSAILYNHESHLRPPGFLSRKVVRAAWRIARGLENELAIGDINARTDWGYAPDYVDAFWRSLQVDAPADYVLATGSPHSVRDWVERAFSLAGLNWQDHVRQDLGFTPAPRATLVGDASLARSLLGWSPGTSFPHMVEKMYELEGLDT